MIRLRSGLAVLWTALMLALAPAAVAATPGPAADCQAHRGTLSRSFSVSALEAALRSIPPSIREYTTCYAVIQDQLNAELGQGAGTPVGNLAGASGSAGGSGTVILIAVIVVVLGAGGATATWALRRNRAS